MSQETDVEPRAREMGWVPQDRFRGDPEKWVDASAFLERAEHVMPLLKANNQRLEGELSVLKGRLSSTEKLVQGAQEALEEFQRYHAADSKRQYERAKAELLDKKAELLGDNDFKGAVEIDERLKDLDKKEEAPKPAGATAKPAGSDPKDDPVFQEWLGENKEWYGVDFEQTKYANEYAAFLAGKGTRGRELLDRVAEKVREKWPAAEGEEAAKPPRAAKVEGGGNEGRRGSGGAKSYRDLPPEVRKDCDRFAERLVGDPPRTFRTLDDWRKQYVQDYFGAEA